MTEQGSTLPFTMRDMKVMANPVIVAGIDVGGPRKGFHAVALRDGAFLAKYADPEPRRIAAWCRDVSARLVGVDAPCRWSADGRARNAERSLGAAGIHCFITPTLETAKTKAFYRWMVNGAELFSHIEQSHPLYAGGAVSDRETACFETFPQAIACALAGRIVPAGRKRTIRRELLREAGVETGSLTNIDTVDAAHCALAAHHLAAGRVRVYGVPGSGLIVIPEREGKRGDGC
jgi:predicted nuclease with RNAse H fold